MMQLLDRWSAGPAVVILQQSENRCGATCLMVSTSQLDRLLGSGHRDVMSVGAPLPSGDVAFEKLRFTP